MSELAQIGVIFTHYHSLCGIVYGLGLTPELDSVGGYFLESRASNGASNSSNNHTQPHANGNTHPHAQGSVPGHGQYVDDLSVNSQDSLVWAPRTAELLNEGGRGSGEDEGEDMDCVESEEAQNEGDARRMDAFTNSETLYDEIKSEDTDRLSMDTRVGDGWPCAHEDFDQKQHSPLRIQDYSWQDQAFSTLNGFLGGVAQLFDDEFKVAIEMTDNHLGLSQVDTTRFRRAIWFYIHRTCGILHDDYDYSEVNKLVERPLKSFIKRITCYPKTTTMKDFLGCRAGLRDAETVHISILATEARKQAELLFFLRALAEYMNS
ncbi:hypothetical protein SARC_08091 [Sphaeroforma arctica JP610]|uniref:Sestrin-1 n=1 Tax=Sphaeroforma arctica JP610 TaxID=667725 RepID=A0A0L0FUA9_9EUKA|nr:hypothetical protein SARC_08091 [Sphaeroforma arctica JP610]KNC79513.1 hypothetical protein SARC_08091 [Sphaeroforma arctica JP610]|eukprot:XP_014153415.1 hypothetical protein SARC_08091 [Sphaeroforma arctica JP610]